SASRSTASPTTPRLGKRCRPWKDKILGTRSLLPWFFFSSRRRHTRLQGDWSSDVCSSDLLPPRRRHGPCRGGAGEQRDELAPFRSEERRVGKECRTRRSAAPNK